MTNIRFTCDRDRLPVLLPVTEVTLFTDSTVVFNCPSCGKIEHVTVDGRTEELLTLAGVVTAVKQ